MTKKIILKIFTDGGARGNPGPAASAFVVYQEETEIFKKGIFLGKASNNIAEYCGVKEALKWCEEFKNSKELNFEAILFYLDSLLVTNQLKGIFKIKNPELAKLVLEIKQLEAKIGTKIVYEHIRRENNKKADQLVNQTLNRELSS